MKTIDVLLVVLVIVSLATLYFLRGYDNTFALFMIVGIGAVARILFKYRKGNS